MKVFIIGGGASGLVSAIKIHEQNHDVTILEQNSKLGKKLLVTGNGHCNYWNDFQDISKYHSNNIDLFKEIFDKQKDKVLNFFDSLGIIPKIKNGYYYPFSNQATSILNALINKIEEEKIKVICNEQVINIKKSDNIFIITTNNNVYKCDKVVISTGSKAFIKNQYLGYEFAKDFNHQIIKPEPSLVALVGNDNYYHYWDGVRAEAKVSLIVDNKLIKEELGEIQFSNYGISGICIFNLSTYLDFNKDNVIKINFVPWYKNNNFKEWLNNQNKKLTNYSLKQILEGFLNYKIVNLIFKLLNIDEKAKWEDIDQDKLVNYLTSFPFIPVKTKEFSNAQTTKGGIPLNEIDINTMESKLVKGLYFTGEILDVNGDCGGYNLGFAWMSALQIKID